MVIADDQALVRGGFRLILTAAGIEVVAEAADGARRSRPCAGTGPTSCSWTSGCRELDGIEATRRILAGGPALTGARIIILTTFDLDQYVYAALPPGPAASCSRTSPPSTWSPPSGWCATGDALLAPDHHPPPGRALRAGSDERPPPCQDRHRDLSALTPRELEVLRRSSPAA